jgi:hypothetical protein
MPMTPAEFGKLVADETEKWRKAVEFAAVSVARLTPTSAGTNSLWTNG